MQPELRWLDDPRVFRVNRLDAHSDHTFFEGEADYAAGESALRQSLDGVWKFAYSESAAKRPARFYEEDFDRAGFDEIAVPGHIELAGYDNIHYINAMYPWEGHCFRRPKGCGLPGAQGEGEFSGAAYNPVGSYVRTFDLKPALRGRRVIIRFEGVEQAMYVWLNGRFIGYAEDTFTPSEFDLTGALRDTGNVLAVEVHKRSTAAYLEDQDFFRFFGIFRSVSLLGLPAAHVEDLWVRPRLDVASGRGSVRVSLRLSGDAQRAEAVVCDGDAVCARCEVACAEGADAVLDMPGPVRVWDSHDPYLYTLEVRLYGADGALRELVPWRFGFRHIAIDGDKVIRLNGRRLILCGVNRHEWNARTGRCITGEDERWDVACMKRNHINAVRTCHYPDRLSFYALCDESGIYMMSETNLESHGSWQKMVLADPSWNVPGSLPEWRDAVLDRAQSHFEWIKNHTAVLFWSLGNESYAGDNLRCMHEYFKEKDPERLVHYEGVFHNRAYEDTVSDVESRMYATPQEVSAYLSDHPKKPFLLCEYMHDMGNSMGGLSEYMELLDRYELYAGGFIWDYIDQALFVRDAVTGREVLRYGGDWDDRPSDYEFSADGIVFADRTEKPAMQEVRYQYGRYDK